MQAKFKYSLNSFNENCQHLENNSVIMWGLLVSTILTSAVDSLNPIAIAQQFFLQGIVKKPEHIWYFIGSMLLTNLVSGFLAYFE